MSEDNENIFPSEVWWNILDGLEIADICIFSLLSKYYRDIVREYMKNNIGRLLITSNLALHYLDAVRNGKIEADIGDAVREIYGNLKYILKTNNDLYAMLTDIDLERAIVAYYDEKNVIGNCTAAPIVFPHIFSAKIDTAYKKVVDEEGNVDRWIPLIYFSECKVEPPPILFIVATSFNLTMDIMTYGGNITSAFEDEFVKFIDFIPPYIARKYKNKIEQIINGVLMQFALHTFKILTIITSEKIVNAILDRTMDLEANEIDEEYMVNPLFMLASE